MAGGTETALKRHLITLVVFLVLLLTALGWLTWLFLQTLL